MALSQQIVEARVRSPGRTRRAVVSNPRVPIHPPLSPALEMLFVTGSELVLKLETSADGQLTLREIDILLGDVLDLLEEDQTIVRAADRLYGAALDVQEAREKRSSCVKITRRTAAMRTKALHAALAGFRVSLWSAKPNAKARARRLAW